MQSFGPKLWNDIVESDPGIVNYDFIELTVFFKHWEGLSVNQGLPYECVWQFTDWNMLHFITIGFFFI